MDLNQQPHRKKKLSLRLQDPNENITSGSKRPTKSFEVVLHFGYTETFCRQKMVRNLFENGAKKNLKFNIPLEIHFI